MCDTHIHPPGPPIMLTYHMLTRSKDKVVRVRDGTGLESDLGTNGDKDGIRVLGVSDAHFLEYETDFYVFTCPIVW